MSQSSSDHAIASDNYGANKGVNKGKSRYIWFSLAIIMLIVGIIFYFAYNSIKSDEASFEQTAMRNMHSVTNSRASEVTIWMKSVLDHTHRFTNSDLLRIFAEEVDKKGDGFTSIGENTFDEEFSDSEGVDMHLMQNHLRDFVAYADFLYAGLSNRHGDIYLSTESRAVMLEHEKEVVNQVIKTGQAGFGPVEATTSKGLVLPIYLPVNSFVKDAQGKFHTVAVLIVTKAISPKLNELFSISDHTTNAFVLQKFGDELQDVSFSQNRVVEIEKLPVDAEGNIPFGVRNSINGRRMVYSYGAHMSLTGWWVVWEQDYIAIRDSLDQNIKNIYIRAGLISVALILLLGAIWWWLIGFERSQVLSKFQSLYGIIEKQKRLLDSINGAISDPISLTDTKGVYRYVNRAFAQAVGRDAKDIPGLDSAAVFGFDTARRFNSSDQHVLMTGESVTTNEMIWLQSKRHYYQVSRTALREGDDRTPTGVVSVYRDVTEVRENEERTRRVVQQTIDALVQAIERSDPFLGGHSRIMSEVARLIARGLRLSEKDSSTIEAAAALSQIGKMFVPREILTKPGILTDEEKRIMEQHVEHTKNIIKNIEFDVPVVEAIYQMNERPDGKGYPSGLKDNDISIYAKVLAVANAFTAMARPRSYRAGMDIETVLATLEKQQGAYDQNIVHILRDSLNSAEGERIARLAASSSAE